VPVEGAPALSAGDAFLLHVAGQAFRPGSPGRIGLAVSGGSDSMAMLHLMARAAPHAGWQVHAVTVDHRLRPEAAAEARFVARACAGLGVPHDTLVWEHGAVAGNLMDAARKARYRLIAGWARAQGISHVGLAHTADDQAETFLMGLAREAGLDGLAGMRRDWTEAGIVFGRPFLCQTRAELRGWLTRNGQGWVDDPSNDDDRFTRVKARRALKALRPLGITVERLNSVVQHLAMALSVVDRATAEAADRLAQEAAGALVLDRNGFGELGPELSRRLLVAALRWMSGAGHPPRAASVERVEAAIRAGRVATLAGCRIRPSGADIRLTREPKAVAAATAAPGAIWDHRWHLTPPEGQEVEGLEIRALGAAGLQACPDWRATGHSRDALLVTPAIWRGDRLIAAPMAGKPAEWTAEIVPSLQRFILSH